MIFQSKMKKPPYTKPLWTHPKCHTDLHTLRPDPKPDDDCYCTRKKLKSTMRVFVFIEVRRNG